MSVPTAELTAASASARSPVPPPSRGWFSGGRLYIWLAGLALVLAALSLLIPSTPSYDPWAWLVWGREIVHLDLHTPGGPSWKPLPVIFTTVFALFGHAAPDLWLVVARAGAIVAVAMAFKLAFRITRDIVGGADDATGFARIVRLLPPLFAGVLAAASLINSGGFISDNALGYSEGFMTALVLVAVDRHLDGARRQALAVGFFAALDRPELWILWGPYGLYLWWKDPGARTLVIGLFAMIPVLWFLPSLWGSGSLSAGVTRALHPRSNSAAFASCPFCTEFTKHAWPRVTDRIKGPGLLAMAVAAFGLWQARGMWWRSAQISPAIKARIALVVLGVVGWLWWIGIALETQAGFSGNDRYLVLGTALISIAGGVGWGWGASAVAGLLRRIDGGRLVSAGAASAAAVTLGVIVLVAAPPSVSRGITSIPATHRALIYQAHLREDLATAVARLGGPARILRCGTVMTEGFQVPMVAYALGVRTLRVQAPPNGIVPPPWPDTILQTRDTSNASLLPEPQQIVAWEHDGAHYTSFRVRTFWVFSVCPGRVGG